MKVLKFLFNEILFFIISSINSQFKFLSYYDAFL